MTTNRTPGPWSVHQACDMEHAERNNCALGAEGSFVPGVFEFYTDDGHGNGFPLPVGNSRADAAFIVRACNAHDELVAALRLIDSAQRDCERYADTPGSGTDWRTYCSELGNIARAALAKAKA